MCRYLSYRYPCGHKYNVLINRCEYGAAGLTNMCTPEFITHKYQFNCGKCMPAAAHTKPPVPPSRPVAFTNQC